MSTHARKSANTTVGGSSSHKSLTDLDNRSKDCTVDSFSSEGGSEGTCNGEPEYKQIKNLNRIPLWLAPCHLIAGIFHCMQAFIMFAFAAMAVDLKWAVVTNFPLPYNAAQEEEQDALLQEHEQDPYSYEAYEEEPIIYAVPGESQIVGYYSVTWLTGFFILCSGLHHIINLLPGIRPRFEYYVERHQSPFRWIEYSMSCGLIRVCICQIAGVTDIHLMLSIFVMTATSIIFPLLHERLNAKARADGYPQDWLGFFCGVFAHLGAWSIIFSYYISSISRGEPPTFASTIVISLFFLDLTFPICFVLQWKKVGIFEDYLAGEFAFIILSFTAKTILAWVTLVGEKGFADI